MNCKKETYYFDSRDRQTAHKLSKTLTLLIDSHFSRATEFVILCIGSDRVTGDSLGPLVGYKLNRFHSGILHIYGTLDSPVHALNLDHIISDIKSSHPGTPILAIDASLGQKKHLGYITVGKGTLHPGSGVNKELTAVGDIFITGIVNISGFLEQMLLQTTRLSTVMGIADCIAQAIQMTFRPSFIVTGNETKVSLSQSKIQQIYEKKQAIQ